MRNWPFSLGHGMTRHSNADHRTHSANPFTEPIRRTYPMDLAAKEKEGDDLILRSHPMDRI